MPLVRRQLFIKPNNAMFLGDAKKSTEKLVSLLGDDGKEADAVQNGDVEAATPEMSKEEKEMEEFLAQKAKLQTDAFLKVGVIKEVVDGEKKVAIVPDGARRLLKSGIQVVVKSGAGMAGDFYDSVYEEMGCIVLESAQAVFDAAEVIVKIREPTMHPETGKHEIDMLAKGKTMISFLGPRTDDGKALMEKGVAAGVNLLAVDAIPRISRAQALDVLSSQAKIAGYRAIVEAASVYQRFLNGEVTAAGSFDAGKVLVIGAGVAGLAAIGAASNMGAIVRGTFFY